MPNVSFASWISDKPKGDNPKKKLDDILGFQLTRWYEDMSLAETLRKMKNSDQKSHRLLGPPRNSFFTTDSQMKACIDEARRVQVNGRVVLLFAGNRENMAIQNPRSVFPHLLNSLIWLDRNEISERLVVVYDRRFKEALDLVGISTCFLDIGFDLNLQKIDFAGAIYLTRLRTIETFLRAGLQIVQTDLDSIWTQRALPILDKYHSKNGTAVGIVASRGTFPKSEAAQWGGSTLCMGVISFQPQDGVIDFIRAAREVSLLHRGDDQIGINRALKILDIRWTHSS